VRLLPAGAFAGWDLHPLESAALSRRTPIGDIGRACESPILFCCVLARRRAQAKINRRALFRCCGGGKMPAMLPYHQYPIPQHEPLIGIIRNHSVAPRKKKPQHGVGYRVGAK
jgi:hypothetical protein